MTLTESASTSRRSRGRRDARRIEAELIAMVERAMPVGDTRHESAADLARVLIDPAFRSLDASYVVWQSLVQDGADPARITRGGMAAALFVRDAGATLRRLLPGAHPAAIVEAVRRRLEEEALGGPGGGRREGPRGLDGPRRPRDLAARMVRAALAGSCGRGPTRG